MTSAAPMQTRPAGSQHRRQPQANASQTIAHDRQLPQNIEAEKSILGGMMMNKDALAEAAQVLHADDFYRPAHSTIYDTIISLFGRGREVDPVIVASELDKNGDLERVGGATYIHDLFASTPTAANVVYYSHIVKEKALLRALAAAGTQAVQLAYAGIDGAEVEAVIDHAQQAIMSVGEGATKEDYASFADLLTPTITEMEHLADHGGAATGVPTGFVQLDDLTSGLHGGQMIIVAARPGVGKSTLALDFMRNASIRHGVTSALFSLEMSKAEVMMRIFSAEANVSLSRMRSGKTGQDEWSSLYQAISHCEDAPIFIDDSPNLTMMEIRAKARRMKQQHNLGLVVVDYLQLMSSGKKVESRQHEVSEFSRQLKLLAKELDVPVIAISQLNRGVESRGDDALPRISDLRESGSLEQDADMVMLINRPDATNRDHERAGEADIILAKHRGGPIGTVTVAHQLQYSKFSDFAGATPAGNGWG